LKVGIILFIIGFISTIFFLQITQKKELLKKLAIVISILLFIYGLILIMQPKDYIKFTKTTISTTK